MKLLRYDAGKGPRLGVLAAATELRIVPLESLTDAIPTMQSIILGGQDALRRIGDVADANEDSFPLAEALLHNVARA